MRLAGQLRMSSLSLSTVVLLPLWPSPTRPGGEDRAGSSGAYALGRAGLSGTETSSGAGE